MLFWYVGGTIAIVRYAFRDERMDLRMLALGALLPDLIDLPIAVAAFTTFRSTRLVGHSLLFAGLLLTGVVLATRRGRPRKRWMPLAIGVLVHLFLAFMWAYPETLWWPFLGSAFAESGATSVWGALGAGAARPLTWLEEAAGFGYLTYLWRRGGLSDAEKRRRFWSNGQIDVPIDRT